MLQIADGVLAKLKVPAGLRPRVSEILAITDEICGCGAKFLVHGALPQVEAR